MQSSLVCHCGTLKHSGQLAALFPLPLGAIPCKPCSMQASYCAVHASSLHSAVLQVPRVDWTPDKADEIQTQLFKQQEPAVIAGALQRWPLMRWKLDDFRRLGDTIVPMEISWSGADYRDLFRCLMRLDVCAWGRMEYVWVWVYAVLTTLVGMGE